MKFLKLKFESAKLIREKPEKNLLGTNRFFHPITNMHIYNSLCVLLDRTPKPQLRKTNDDYMPFYPDIMDVVNNGYIKIKLVNDNNKITTIKKSCDSNVKSAKQYTWKDCNYVLGNLQPIFVHYVSEILDLDSSKVLALPFDTIIKMIQSYSKPVNRTKTTKKGESSDVIDYLYENEKILKLIKWLRLNAGAVISNYIENKQEDSKATLFGRRINRGNVDAHTYAGIIYIQLTPELYDELIHNSKGFANILDGGLVSIAGYGVVLEDDIEGFKQIKDLNSTRKFNESTLGVNWENTIYKNLKPNSLKQSIDDILNLCGVSISDNKVKYDKHIKEWLDLDFNGENHSVIAYKINKFIEDSINNKNK